MSTSTTTPVAFHLKRRSKSLGDLKTKRAPVNVTPLPLDCKDELHQYSDASTPTTPVISFTLDHPTLSCTSVPRRRHSSSYCGSSNKECVRLATIYGWRLTTTSNTQCDHSMDTCLSRDVHADVLIPSPTPSCVLQLQQTITTTTTTPSPKSDTDVAVVYPKLSKPTKRPSQLSLSCFPSPPPRSPPCSPPPLDHITTPTSTTSVSSKLSKMFTRRQTLTPTSSFSRRRSSTVTRNNNNKHTTHHHHHDEKTKGIVSAIIAVANQPDHEHVSLGWVGVEDTTARETPCLDTDDHQTTLQRPPTPPIENDPHVFDLLANNSKQFIMFSRRNDKDHVMTSATAEKLVEKLTCEMDSEFMMDFFLTYRQFLTHIKLCKLLILRFRWALLQSTDDHLLVRIRTFVVIRYWMIHYWQHDFSTSRTLRFMLSTFLSQLRTHPTIVNSPRDSRIIHNLRSLFKRQRKLHNNEHKHGDLSVRSSLSNLDTLTTQSSGIPFPTQRSDTSYRSSSNDAWHSSSRAGSRKDSAIGIAPPQALKPSVSTPALPFLTRRRRLSSTSHRSVNNAWSAKMNFSLKTIKRSVPTMYNSIRQGLHPTPRANSIANDMDTRCQCSAIKENDIQKQRGSMDWIGKRPLHERQHEYKLKHPQSSSNVSVRNSVHPAGCSLHTPPSPLHYRLPDLYQPFILQYRSEIIAQQFCCIEQQLLQNVTWDELVELRWRKNQQQHRNAGKRVLEDESELWRRQRQGCGTCQWITSEIVQTRSLETRIRVIEKYIRIALKCFHHRNYSTLMQILLGLQSPAVSRLERTWQRLDQYELRIFGELKELAKPFLNWKSVRHAMSQAIQQMDESSAVESVLTKSRVDASSNHRGCIPFLGLYLSDLVFNSELPDFISLPSRQPSSSSFDQDDDSFLRSRLTTQLVNYNKFRTMASIVKHVLTFQVLSRAYHFQHHPELYTRLQNLDFLDNSEIRSASLMCEN
ncbi:ras GEF [Lichtheimia hyalospora FSU 10163]|nr:ras GEF [Lichtheimia hyalospora FSU 10163]